MAHIQIPIRHINDPHKNNIFRRHTKMKSSEYMFDERAQTAGTVDHWLQNEKRLKSWLNGCDRMLEIQWILNRANARWWKEFLTEQKKATIRSQQPVESTIIHNTESVLSIYAHTIQQANLMRGYLLFSIYLSSNELIVRRLDWFECFNVHQMSSNFY